MRRVQREQAEEGIHKLEQFHERIRSALEMNSLIMAKELLPACQEQAIEVGNIIESAEGEKCPTIKLLEDYCEKVYQANEILESDAKANKVYKSLKKALIQIQNSLRNDINIKKEAVFLPYKASMWDSMESVWQAASEDEEYDTYVIPIPCYERNPDGSLGTYYYEGELFPDYVPVTNYKDYDIRIRKPDVIYIHNPYDNTNIVTSVAPQFYSSELKKYTRLLIYIPYYVASGGMAEGQALCPAYVNADYIVLQSEKYGEYIHPSIPREKLLPLGSPKIDKVIRLCAGPAEFPEEWRDKLYQGTERKKVYFYNTSIGSMLGNTEAFLKKLQYVFQCFQGREDVCLLWRPHPLLESSFQTMRCTYKPIYDKIKNWFLENQIGIYDDTPDIEKTIALSDAYIGEESSSVVTLFGITGKPIFILNQDLHTAPQEEDWRGEKIKIYQTNGRDEWCVTNGNKLYHAPNNDYHYEYVCDLTEYASGDYYAKTFEIGEKVYACPVNAEHIAVVEKGKVTKRIELKHEVQQMGAFYDAWQWENYIFLIPFRYPAVVRIDTTNDKLDYLYGYQDFISKNMQGQWRFGGSCIWREHLCIANPADNQMLMIACTSLQARIVQVGDKRDNGGLRLIPYEDEIWILPYQGKTIIRWKPDTMETWEYGNLPEGFECINYPYGQKCEEKPFWGCAVYEDNLVISPYWGNMFLHINKISGEIKEWVPPIEFNKEIHSDYYNAFGTEGFFMTRTDSLGQGTYRYLDYPKRRIYDIHIPTGRWKEIPIAFKKEELWEQESGFCEQSQWQQYCCMENAINSLADFLNGTIKGGQHNCKQQIVSWQSVIADSAGTCGCKIHQFVKNYDM